jgi:hypothetical protein
MPTSNRSRDRQHGIYFVITCMIPSMQHFVDHPMTTFYSLKVHNYNIFGEQLEV